MKIGEQVELMRQALLGRKIIAVEATADRISLVTEESTIVLGFLESREFTMQRPHKYRALIARPQGDVELESTDREALRDVMALYNLKVAPVAAVAPIKTERPGG